jgi:hypothetical protein
MRGFRLAQHRVGLVSLRWTRPPTQAEGPSRGFIPAPPGAVRLYQEWIFPREGPSACVKPGAKKERPAQCVGPLPWDRRCPHLRQRLVYGKPVRPNVGGQLAVNLSPIEFPHHLPRVATAAGVGHEVDDCPLSVDFTLGPPATAWPLADVGQISLAWHGHSLRSRAG